jgi:hypothetical protein
MYVRQALEDEIGHEDGAGSRAGGEAQFALAEEQGERVHPLLWRHIHAWTNTTLVSRTARVSCVSCVVCLVRVVCVVCCCEARTALTSSRSLPITTVWCWVTRCDVIALAHTHDARHDTHTTHDTTHAPPHTVRGGGGAMM